MSKSAIIIVPGAWHGPWAYQTIVDLLHSAGYDAVCVDLPSIAPASSPRFGLAEDIIAVKNAINGFVDQGRTVVVAPHSYGGVPVAEACYGMGVEERKAAGKEGGVKALVYISAFMIPAGVTLLQSLGGNHLPWFDLRGDLMYWKPNCPAEIFYNDIPPSDAAAFTAKLEPISYSCFLTPTTCTAWLSLPTTFVHCARDNALPPSVQDLMISSANLSESAGQVVRLDCGHSPFMSQPEKIVEILMERA